MVRRFLIQRSLVVCLLLAASACADTAGAPEPGVLATTDELSLPAATDRDPAAGVVEIALEAKVATVDLGRGPVTMWTYNGALPGPRIEATVGDTVRVVFTNSLPEATTIHWHGLRVPNAMDGVPALGAPIPPGGTFTYEFTVPDAGTFWYHPHVRSDEQVERGLYGAFVVRAANEPVVTSEHVVVLDDVLLGTDGQLAPFSENDAMIGRQGALLANGRMAAVGAVAAGGLHRVRFVNAANARYFRIALAGHTLVRIGSDAGFLTTPEPLDDLLLVPGERADVLFVAPATEGGDDLRWQNLPYDRGHETGGGPTSELFTLRLAGPPIATPPAVPLPGALGTVVALGPPTVTRELRLQEMAMGGGGHGGHGDMAMPAVFMFNDVMPPAMERFEATLGAIEEWTLENTTEMDHPFHLHGFRFQTLSIDGTPAAEPAWHDTVNVPAGAKMLIRTALEERPGTWMFHCHILEHAERGMMGELVVTDAP